MGRSLTYDYRSGFVVDTSSGEVIDRIYVNYEPRSREEEGAVVQFHEPVHMWDEESPYYLEKSKYGHLERVKRLADELKKYRIPVSDYEIETILRPVLKKINMRRYMDPDAYAAALLYVALEQMGIILGVPFYAKILDMDQTKLYSSIMYVKRALGSERRSIPFKKQVKLIAKLYMYILGVANAQMYQKIQEILEKAEFRNMTPSTAALGLILYLSPDYKRSILISKGASLGLGTENTMRKALRLVAQAAEKAIRSAED